MIAKAILDMFSLSPAASRSAAQNSEQPLQAFSESLLVASKSFLQGASTSDSGTKADRRQRSTADNANASSAACGSGAVLSLIVSPQTQGIAANSNPLPTSSSEPEALEGRSTAPAGRFIQSLASFGFAWSKSGKAQTSVSQAAIIQSKFTQVQMLPGRITAIQNDSNALSTLNPRNLRSAGLAKTQSGISQASIAPTSIVLPPDVQSTVAPAQMPLTGLALTQDTATVLVTEAGQRTIETGLPRTQSSAAQTGVTPEIICQSTVDQSNTAPAQMPLAGAATRQDTSTIMVGQPTQRVSKTGIVGTQSSVARASTVPINVSRPSVSNSGAGELKFTAVQEPLAGSSMPQMAVAGVAMPATWNPPLAGLARAQAIVAQASTNWTSMNQPAGVQSKFTTKQMPLVGMAAIQNAPAVLASPQTQDIPERELAGIQSSASQARIVPTNVPQTAALDSNFAAVEMPFVAPATTQNTSTVLDSQPTHTVPAVRWNESESSIVPTNVARIAAVQSSVTPAQMPLSQPVSVQENPIEPATQPTRNVKATEWVETQTSVVQTNDSQSSAAQQTIVQLADVQSRFSPLSSDQSQSSSKLPGTQIQEMRAPIAESPKSGNDGLSTADPAVSVAPPATNNSGVQNSLPAAAANALSGAVQNAIANDPTEANVAPVLRAALIASAKDVTAAVLKTTGSTVQNNPQPAAADQISAAKTVIAPGAIADQLASFPNSAAPAGTTQTEVSSLKPVSAAKPQVNASAADKAASTDQTTTKKSTEPASEAGSKAGSQDATSSNNQSQGGNTSQSQNAASVPVNFTVHPAAVIAAAQNAATVLPSRTSSTPAGSAGLAEKATGNTAPASTALPQAAPVINTAKLVQSMSQSVMRLGMRSNEFGNISISTSSTRDVVSAQISLEHGELAKTLAAHLPEMQARLGGNQPMDVRIDMNGASTSGQETGSFSGMSNDSAGQSRSGRQQASNVAQSQSGSGVAEQQFSTAAAALPTGYARLDIRV